MEHDFYVGIGLAIVLTYLVKTQGPAYTAEYVNVINISVVNGYNLACLSFLELSFANFHPSISV